MYENGKARNRKEEGGESKDVEEKKKVEKDERKDNKMNKIAENTKKK